jgi:hypothetical protein
LKRYTEYKKLLGQLDPAQTTRLLAILESGGLDDSFYGPVTPEYASRTRKLACDIALTVCDLWAVPDVVRQYLTNQDESLKGGAHAAASDFMKILVWDFSRSAARSAAHASFWATSDTETPAKAAWWAAAWWLVAVTEDRE